MEKVQCISTRFDTLEHMVGETFIFFLCTSLNFSKIFCLITKVFITIHEYANEILFI